MMSIRYSKVSITPKGSNPLHRLGNKIKQATAFCDGYCSSEQKARKLRSDHIPDPWSWKIVIYAQNGPWLVKWLHECILTKSRNLFFRHSGFDTFQMITHCSILVSLEVTLRAVLW